MITLRFDEDHRYQDDKIELDIRLAVAPIIRVRMVLDTGASISTMHVGVLDMLGIADPRVGRPGTIQVANGEQATCWIHEVDILVFDRRLTIDVAFAPDWRIQNLLGMRGFMDQMVFAVDHAEHALHIRWPLAIL